MNVRLRLRTKLRSGKPLYPIRPFSLLVSLSFHGLIIAALLILPQSGGSRRPIYDEQIKPYEHKIIIYRLPKKLPDVTSGSATSEKAKAVTIAKRTFIAQSPKPVSAIQIIQTPAPEIKINRDIPLPNVIAKLDTEIPPIPNQPKPAKKFIPPPNQTTPKLPMKMAVIDASAPQTQSTPSEVPGAQFRGSLPSSISIPSPVPSKGNATADVAVASLKPSAGAPEIPSGERAGSFSESPTKGKPSEGAGSGLTVPNLTVHEEKPVKEEPATLPSKLNTIVYAERVRGIPPATLSAPLRPNTRSIPRAVEGFFPGRSVYTMVIPIENLPAYSGDWIVWFAEVAPETSETPLMRAPVPLRKLEQIAAVRARRSVRAQISATLTRKGYLEKIALINRSDSATEHAIVDDLTSWEFKPATRNGVPTDVQMVMEITFNLLAAAAP